METLRSLLFLPEGTSTFADRIDRLHAFIFIVTMAAFVALTVVMVGFLIKYRRKTERQHTLPFHPPLWLEGLFVGGPFVIFMTWFAMGFQDFVWLHHPPADTFDIYVIGKKWMWKFSYPEGPNAIDTLRVPQGRPVRLLITSRDVIHSFYLPTMRIKQDALPGRYTETWFTATKPGVYPVYCAEYCGLNHSTMTGRVVVMPPDEFDAWLSQEKAQTYASRIDGDPSQAEAEPTLVAQGQRLALEKGCARCHTIDGTPHLGPTWHNLYRSRRPLTSGETVIADEAYLTRSMMDPQAQRVTGYETVMPSYQGQLSMGEVAALVEFIKSLAKDKPTTLGALP